jgi:glutathione S-transferase
LVSTDVSADDPVAKARYPLVPTVNIQEQGAVVSNLKIYGVPLSRAYRALWMANELGLDYENVPIHFADGSAKTPQYLAVNPNGRIPAIDDNGFKLWESMAINLYLAKKHGSVLLPKTLEGEAEAIQWSFWVMTEVEKPALAVLLHRLFLPKDQRDAKLANEGENQLQKPLAVLDQRLATTGYLVGPTFTVADLNVASVLSWARIGGVAFAGFLHVDRWLAVCLQRPAAAKARSNINIPDDSKGAERLLHAAQMLPDW